MLARALRETLAVAPFRLVSLDGGKSWNAIPRDATAICSLPAEGEAAFRGAVETAAGRSGTRTRKTDPDLDVDRDDAADAADAWTTDATADLLDLVAVVPSGPLAMSPDFQGLVETSTSVGEAVTDGPAAQAAQSLALVERLGTSRRDRRARCRRAAPRRFLRGDPGDPGWRANLDSPALAAWRRVYERLFGEPPIVTAVHAWLETAVIGDKVPGLDMVSFGPQIEAPHSPDERVSIPTVERGWRLLAGIVDELSAA